MIMYGISYGVDFNTQNWYVKIYTHQLATAYFKMHVY